MSMQRAPIHAEPQAQGVQVPPQSQFRCGVAAGVALHGPAHSLAAGPRLGHATSVGTPGPAGAPLNGSAVVYFAMSARFTHSTIDNLHTYCSIAARGQRHGSGRRCPNRQTIGGLDDNRLRLDCQ